MDALVWLGQQAASLLRMILSEPWYLVGFCGQLFFTMRFLVQWVHSERHRRSLIPVAFWFFSMGGGAVLLSYAIYRQDPVFILGQAFGLIIYSRNLYFIFAGKAADGSDPELSLLRKDAEDLAIKLQQTSDLSDITEIEERLDGMRRRLREIGDAHSRAKLDAQAQPESA